MAYTPIPTYVTNQKITAAHGNTYWKDNFAALWPYANAGDISYASASNVLSKITIGTVGQVLTVNPSVIPEWKNAAGLVDIKIADSDTEKTYSTSSWEDHPNLSVTLSLPRTSTIIVMAIITGNVYTTNAGYGFIVRSLIDGTADALNSEFNGSMNPSRNEALPYFWCKTGVAAGNRVVKIQSKESADGIDNRITNGRLIALAFGE